MGGAAAKTGEGTLLGGSRDAVARARAGWERALRILDGIPPVRIVAAFVVAEWIATLALALVVRHNGFVYYQGGDQLWSYTLAWLLGHGHLGQPLVGYLWSGLLVPLTWIAGPNLVGAYPTIVVVDVVVLLPLALASLYGLARLIAGRRFAALTLLVWLVTPFVGVLFTDQGYHQRYTELLLPQAFGLTAMTDFPTMVAALVAAYFVARIVFDGREAALDALAAGVAGGAAVGLKPSAALFFAGPALALVFLRRFRSAALIVAGILPAVVTLTVWKYRGYGYLPLLHSGFAAPVRTAAAQVPVALGLPHYAHFDWRHFETQLDLLREHFWSGRLIEWLIVAGLIAIGRRSRAALALVGGWYLAFAIVKGGYSIGSIEDSSLLRLLIPSIPAFVLMLASLPYLVPRGRRPWPVVEPSPRVSRRIRIWGIGAAAVVTTLVPLAAIAAASPIGGPEPPGVVIQQPLIPNVALPLTATRAGRDVRLSWPAVHSSGGAVFYHVFRSPAGQSALDCDDGTPAVVCQYKGTDLGATKQTSFVDRPPQGRWQYRLGVSANWLDDPTLGDVYELGLPVVAR